LCVDINNVTVKTTSNRHARKEALLMSWIFIASQHLYVRTW